MGSDALLQSHKLIKPGSKGFRGFERRDRLIESYSHCQPPTFSREGCELEPLYRGQQSTFWVRANAHRSGSATCVSCNFAPDLGFPAV
jgi:hypothetical protein